jgi:hypothetical protein
VPIPALSSVRDPPASDPPAPVPPAPVSGRGPSPPVPIPALSSVGARRRRIPLRQSPCAGVREGAFAAGADTGAELGRGPPASDPPAPVPRRGPAPLLPIPALIRVGTRRGRGPLRRSRRGNFAAAVAKPGAAQGV